MRALPGFHLFSASSRVNIFTFRIRIKDDYFLVQRMMIRYWLRAAVGPFRGGMMFRYLMKKDVLRIFL